jgi:hypothetical protein
MLVNTLNFINRVKHKRACITRENNAHWIDMKSSHLYFYSAFNNTDCVKALNTVSNWRKVCHIIIRLNIQFSVKGISLLNSEMSLSSSV